MTTTRLGQRYVFEAAYDTASGRLRVVQRLRLTNRAGHAINAVNLSVIPRALGSFSLREVKVDGEAANRTWTTTTNLRVRLGRMVQPGGQATIALGYTVTPKLQTGAFSARLAREAGVSSFGEWFPIVSREHDSYGVGDPQVSFTADSMRLELTTSSRLRRNAVACPGRVQAPAVRGRHWTCQVAEVRDFGFTVNPDYHVRSRTVDGTLIRVHAETVSGEITLDKAARALRRLNDLYGRYPYPDLVLAEVGGSSGFSMEYPRQIHLTRSKVTDTYVVYHEVAHQWFYGLLGNDQMREPWLDEGFSDFTARYLMGISANQCSSKNIDVSVFAFAAGLTSGGNWTECQGYFFTVFNKTTEMLYQVRARMGSADFFAAMRAHIRERRYGMTNSRAMLRHLEGWDAADLGDLYRRYTWRY
ncbi:MAG TPA: M1 family aminopeptidase [Candidatus Limnocylindria bacterium]|nr:M1 family aminopeptidase [Candidatus Limnocylindria bacterium]